MNIKKRYKDRVVKVKNAVIKKDIGLVTKALYQTDERYLVEVSNGCWVSMLVEHLEFVSKQDRFLYYMNFERPLRIERLL